MSKLNIIINNQIVQGLKGETILEMARRLDVTIPTLCHDDRLEPFSSCYLCVVEVEGMRGLQPACSTKVTEGMRIYTDNARVHKSRKFALELLVSNHYADCTPPCREECPAGWMSRIYLHDQQRQTQRSRRTDQRDQSAARNLWTGLRAPL